jgi:hypothetical protein
MRGACQWGRRSRPPPASLAAVLGALQDEAARLGCNAVIRVRYDRGAESATATGVAVWLEQRPTGAAGAREGPSRLRPK